VSRSISKGRKEKNLSKVHKHIMLANTPGKKGVNFLPVNIMGGGDFTHGVVLERKGKETDA